MSKLKSKNLISLIVILIIVLVIIYLLLNSSKKDLSNTNWKISVSETAEYIEFGHNNIFSYYYSYNNPVEEYKNCTSYKFDKDNMNLILSCGIEKDQTIKVEYFSKNKIVLVANGNRKIFEKIK